MVWAGKNAMTGGADPNGMWDLSAANSDDLILASRREYFIIDTQCFNSFPASGCIYHCARRKALVADDADEIARLKQMKLLVIRDGNLARRQMAIPRPRAVDAELRALAERLLADRERRQDQDSTICLAYDVFGPHELLDRLSKTRICEDRRLPLADRPVHEGLLEVEQKRRHPDGREAGERAELSLALEERGVGVALAHRMNPSPATARAALWAIFARITRSASTPSVLQRLRQ